MVGCEGVHTAPWRTQAEQRGWSLSHLTLRLAHLSQENADVSEGYREEEGDAESALASCLGEADDEPRDASPSPSDKRVSGAACTSLGRFNGILVPADMV